MNLQFPSTLIACFSGLLLAALSYARAQTGGTDPGAQSAVAEGLSTGDWTGIRDAYEAGRHAAYPVEGGFQVRNPEQGWRTRFDGRGFLVNPDAGGWTWGLELERYGFAGAERQVTRPARVHAAGGRVAYAWDAALEEWYVNDARGLEHGYTLHGPPPKGAQDAESPLTFTLAVRGRLEAEITADGRGVRFLDAADTAALDYTGLSVLDADGRELRARFTRAGDGLLLTVDERGARYPLTIDPLAQQAYLKASNTDAEDRFGNAVAVSGDTVVVGAPRESSSATGVNGNQADDSLLHSGAAYVFVRSGSGWVQQAYLKASNPQSSDQFGNAVAISGDTVVVGAWLEASSSGGVNGNQNDNTATAAGAAYVFVRSGASWSQQAYLKAASPGAIDVFGWSVAASGDTVVVGAWGESSNATGVNGDESDDSATSAGAAYVFTRTGTSWSQEAYLKASNTDTSDFFGWSVAASGDTVVVGAPWEDSQATGVNGNDSDDSVPGAGAAYVFVRSGTSWSQEAYLKSASPDMNDVLGYSVAVSGDTALAGAWGEASNATGVNGDDTDVSAPGAGSAWVFARNGTSWSQEAYLKASNTHRDDSFGLSVALSGDVAVIGAPMESSGATGVNGDETDDGSPAAGAAYVFARSGTTWSQTAYLKASNTDADDQFGGAVAVSGGTVVVGAYRESSNASGVNGDGTDDSANWAGAAYVYAEGLGTPYCTAGANSTGAPAAMSASGSASVAANDLLLRAAPVPDQPGVFFYGPQQTSIPFGNGTLCIAGQIGRLDVVNASGNVMTFALDNTSPPSGPTQITPGSTWNFQAWFRDPVAGGAFFDLSDGLTVTFGP